MAQLIRYTERGREYVAIVTEDFTDEEFEEEYGVAPEDRAEILGDVTRFPTDRGLSEQ